MSKKSRFDMLEVTPTNNKEASNKGQPQGKKSPEKKSVPKKAVKSDLRVIIEEDEFKKNLEKHRLKEDIKNIKHQKKVIAQNVDKLKKAAKLKIYIGAGFIFVAVVDLLLGFLFNGFKDTNFKKQLIFIAFGLIVITFFNKKEKK